MASHKRSNKDLRGRWARRAFKMLAADRVGAAVTRMLIRFRRAPARTVGRQRSVQYLSTDRCGIIPAANVRIDRFYQGRTKKAVLHARQ